MRVIHERRLTSLPDLWVEVVTIVLVRWKTVSWTRSPWAEWCHQHLEHAWRPPVHQKPLSSQLERCAAWLLTSPSRMSARQMTGEQAEPGYDSRENASKGKYKYDWVLLPSGEPAQVTEALLSLACNIRLLHATTLLSSIGITMLWISPLVLGAYQEQTTLLSYKFPWSPDFCIAYYVKVPFIKFYFITLARYQLILFSLYTYIERELTKVYFIKRIFLNTLNI